MAEKQEHSSARNFHSCSSKLVCPVSLVSLLICTAALVRVEIINQRVHDVEDLVADAWQNQNLIEASSDATSFKRSERVQAVGQFDHKITKERKDATEVHIGRTRRSSSEAGTKPDDLTMESVRSEINKTINSLTLRSFCSSKEQICVQGPPGMQGPKGSRGRRGPRGVTGRKGSSGSKGNQGPHGKQGIVGPPGERGKQGIMGQAGQKGEQGIMGPPGRTGEQGNSGPPGPKGNQGITGQPGLKGKQGIIGAPGPKGNQGIIGQPGSKGKQGIIGPPGPKGNQGIMGPSGLKGNQGFIGSPGPKGKQGIMGPPGPKGNQGLTGPPGQKGNQGFIGSPGPKGEVGIEGVPGPSGSPGAKGERGDSFSPPTIVISPTKQTIAEWNSARFQCSVGGNPKPSVTWLGKSSTPLRSQDGRLDLPHVTFDDAGEYTCIGRNLLGITSQTATLTVVEPAECTSYSNLTSGDRKTTYISQSYQCDNHLNGWYRFQGAAGIKMPTSCPPKNRCGTAGSGWLNGAHPTVADGKVTRQVCFHWSPNKSSKCCRLTTNIEVRNCGSFYVYHFSGSRGCYHRYCGTD